MRVKGFQSKLLILFIQMVICRVSDSVVDYFNPDEPFLPEFPDCQSTGETFQEAYDGLMEAMEDCEVNRTLLFAQNRAPFQAHSSAAGQTTTPSCSRT
jgi:hypothetical protein